MAFVICFKGLGIADFKELAQKAPFLNQMNIVFDVGNASLFLQERDFTILTFLEDSPDKEFDKTEDLVSFLLKT